MKKAILTIAGITTALVALAGAVFLIFTYWDKIVSTLTAGARVATNILNTFTGDKIDQDDPSDYYDI